MIVLVDIAGARLFLAWGLGDGRSSTASGGGGARPWWLMDSRLFIKRRIEEVEIVNKVPIGLLISWFNRS